jgi:hypothetical protein
VSQKTKGSSSPGAKQRADKPTGAPEYTFDRYKENTLAPRVAHHDENQERYDTDGLSSTWHRSIPLAAFGAVTSTDAQRYFPHNNGWGPLLVVVDPATKHAEVRAHSKPAKTSSKPGRHVVTYDILAKSVDFLRFWNGYAPYNHGLSYDEAIGNAVLFETKSSRGLEYLLVAGASEMSFVLPEGHPPIKYFSSKVDRNDVPCPYAWSASYVYCSMNYPGIEYTELKNLSRYVKSGSISSFFYGNRDWQTNRERARMTEEEREKLVALPTKPLPSEIVDHPTP